MNSSATMNASCERASTPRDNEPIPAAPPVSCLIYTLNEEVNLPHCLASLRWCDDVVVIDSHSTDATPELARAAGARVVQHAFTGFGDQRNWSLENVALKHPWALILDADERVPPELVAEMTQRLPATGTEVAAYRVRRRFHLWGRWLRHCSLYPTWVVRLVRVGRVRYINRGHAETQVVDGKTEALDQDLLDENHKPLSDWWRRQERYAAREAEYELAQPRPSWRGLTSRDPLLRRQALKSLARDLPGRPFWYFLYVFLLRLGFLEGLDGLRFCRMKAAYQAMIVRKKRALRCSSPERLWPRCAE
jgi:glycosyltransferase involved in cell wall biosynthesis